MVRSRSPNSYSTSPGPVATWPCILAGSLRFLHPRRIRRRFTRSKEARHSASAPRLRATAGGRGLATSLTAARLSLRRSIVRAAQTGMLVLSQHRRRHWPEEVDRFGTILPQTGVERLRCRCFGVDSR